MTYQLVYTRRAVKDIRRLDANAKQRLKSTLEKYRDDPLFYAQRLINSEFGTYRFRIGDYRVIFDIENDQIVILWVGHRREIYRNI